MSLVGLRAAMKLADASTDITATLDEYHRRECARIQQRCDPPDDLPPLDDEIPDELPPVFNWEPGRPTKEERNEFHKKHGVKISRRKAPFTF